MHVFGEPLPPMPMLRVVDEDAQRRDRMTTAFFSEMMARGILMHPRHLWFLCGEHSAQDVRRTLDTAEEAMGIIAAREIEGKHQASDPGAC
jgi:glutamate-1-semialdehyde aminotransferase